jgi:hypothetical protein
MAIYSIYLPHNSMSGAFIIEQAIQQRTKSTIHTEIIFNLPLVYLFLWPAAGHHFSL